VLNECILIEETGKKKM